MKSLFSFPEVLSILSAQLFYTSTFSLKSQLWHFICPEKWTPFLVIKKTDTVRHKVLPPLSFMPGRFSLSLPILAFPLGAEEESLSLSLFPLPCFTFHLSFTGTFITSHLPFCVQLLYPQTFEFLPLVHGVGAGLYLFFDSWNYCVSGFISRDFKIP